MFIGGAHTVTGSKTLLDTPSSRVLVDCGLFQGRKELRVANWQPFPVPPESIDALVLTHAHVDHCGYVPRLHRLGYQGPVFATHGTCDLAAIVLPDSGHLQEEEAAYANRMGFSKHHPAEALYTAAEAVRALDLFEPVPYGQSRTVAPGVEVTWRRAGHILGSAVLQITTGDTTTVFSGDLGRPTHPILAPPDPPGVADTVVIESTYGDTEHVTVDADEIIADVVRHAARRGGVVIVPAFAVDRTEVVLWHLDRLVASGDIPSVPVVVDSPMASRALDVYRDEVRRGSPEIRDGLAGSRLFTSLDLTETRSTEQSKALNERRGPFVIVSASGMATGGRVIHHLSRRIGDHNNTVLLVGFQAPGTRGDRLRHGARSIRMLGRDHPVRARIVSLELSAHADRSELLDWLGSAQGAGRVIVNHGEADASLALAAAVERRLGVPALVPHAGQRVPLRAVDASVVPGRATA
jgi:metallo-beta-lactamase family protein